MSAKKLNIHQASNITTCHGAHHNPLLALQTLLAGLAGLHLTLLPIRLSVPNPPHFPYLRPPCLPPRRLAGATESVQSGSRRGAVRQQLEGDLVG